MRSESVVGSGGKGVSGDGPDDEELESEPPPEEAAQPLMMIKLNRTRTRSNEFRFFMAWRSMGCVHGANARQARHQGPVENRTICRCSAPIY